MRVFDHHYGRAAALRMDNVDTDVIITMDNLLSTPRAELGRCAFSSLRYLPSGLPDPGFVLNDERFAGASVLVAGRNFGAGSSREGAVYALDGIGIRVVVAPSFGDIFYGNCLKNGILPIRLGEDKIEALMTMAEASIEFFVDLNSQQLQVASHTFAFAIDAAQKTRLLAGEDEVAATLRNESLIESWQARDRNARPWVWTPAAR